MLADATISPDGLGPLGGLLAAAFVLGPPVWIAASRLIPNRIKTKIVATCEDGNGSKANGKKTEFYGDSALSKAVADAINCSNTTEIEERQRRDKEIADKQHAIFEELRALRASSFQDYNQLRSEAMDDFRSIRLQMNEEFRQVMHWIRNMVQVHFTRLGISLDIPEPPKTNGNDPPKTKQ